MWRRRYRGGTLKRRHLRRGRGRSHGERLCRCKRFRNAGRGQIGDRARAEFLASRRARREVEFGRGRKEGLLLSPVR